MTDDNENKPTAAARKIGVYVCHCGGNISDEVDVEKVCERAGKMPEWPWPGPTCSCAPTPVRK